MAGPLRARLAGFLLLAGFGAHHWMLMLEPAATDRALYALAVGLAICAGLLVAARMPRRALRVPALAMTLTAGMALAVVAAGADDALLAPQRWDGLAAGVWRGLEGVPSARVPYGGVDGWLSYVIVLGGTALTGLAAVVSFWPRRGGRAGWLPAAVVVLVALYAVPAVALELDAEFLRGAILAVLVLAFARFERLDRREAGAAAGVAVAAVTLSLVVAPALDGLDPWWNYEDWAGAAAKSGSTAFQWSHDYGPLRWPRDGRELLRVRSPARGYWKAEQLDVFDGRSWTRDQSSASARQSPGMLVDGVDPELLERWTHRIRVSVRDLRSDTFVAAGAVQDIRMPGGADVPTTRAGIYAAPRPLVRGDAYEAVVYMPQPDEGQLRAAGTAYGSGLGRYTRVGVRTGAPGNGLGGRPRATEVAVERFAARPTVASLDGVGPRQPAADLLRSGDLRRTASLAARLRARSATPLDYVKRVERHLSRGFAYSETPPRGSETLEGFLFDTKVGFCQQYAGSMALLLRLGGVPARVAAGFSAGSYDEEAKEYVVRDTDAHSWVEVWFPGVGWVPRDPTPTTAPARAQEASAATAPDLGGRDLGITRAPGAGPAAPSGRLPLWVLPLALGLAAAGVALVRRLRRRGPAGRSRGPVTELERALRIAGGGLPAGTTLTGVEARFASDPAAAAYVRALRQQRFAGVSAAPTAAQRRAVRRALAAGGPMARLRAWWAVPPRVGG